MLWLLISYRKVWTKTHTRSFTRSLKALAPKRNKCPFLVGLCDVHMCVGASASQTSVGLRGVEEKPL